MFACEKKEKKSQYKGVTWYKNRKKWFVQLNIKGGKQKFGGTFDDELDAAKRVNQLCEELRIPLKNPEISAKQNQQNQVTIKFVLSHGIVRKSELQKLNFFDVCFKLNILTFSSTKNESFLGFKV